MNAMNTPKLAIAMNYIRDDLISGAIDYKPAPRKKITYFWKHIVAVAACFCVIVTGGLFFHHQNIQPEDMTDLHEIIQGGENADIVRTSGFALYNSVACEESQYIRKFYTSDTFPIYAVINNSVFDSETVTMFAENATSAGWFTDYSIEYSDGVYSIINNDISSTPVATNSMGGKEITDQFLTDAGISEWLYNREIEVKYGDITSDSVPAKYYHLTVDGHYFADNIQLVVSDAGIVLECNLDIREYEQSEKMVTIMPFAEALKDTFCISAISTADSLEIYNAQLCYVSGMPVYLLSGISGDGTPTTACAIAFDINDPQCATQIYKALK